MVLALLVFIWTEIIRLIQLPYLSTWITHYFASFKDVKDQGNLILSHIYLLIGCAFPVWVEV
jgi:dolichol kinase